MSEHQALKGLNPFDLAYMPAEEVGELIGIEPEGWAWNCHGVSIALRQAGVPGRVRRGIHLSCRGQHSWVALPNDQILDATAHAFIGGPAKVRIIDPPAEAYDPCSWRQRIARLHPAPDVLDTERELVEVELGSAEYVAGLLRLPNEFWGEDWLQCSFEQVFWLANCPVTRSQGPGMNWFYAAEVYEAIAELGQKALIPIDDWHHVMDVPYEGEPPR